MLGCGAALWCCVWCVVLLCSVVQCWVMVLWCSVGLWCGVVLWCGAVV